LNTIDIILSVLLLIGLVRGFMKGFIFEIAVLGIIVVLYFFGFKLADIAAGYISKWMDAGSMTIHYVSLFVVWIGVSIAIFFIARLLEGLVKIVALGLFNKIAGAAFGAIKYACVMSVLLFFVNKVDFRTSWWNADKKAESVLYAPLSKIAPSVFSVLEGKGN
jgi:membrane protein required for colicin V production